MSNIKIHDHTRQVTHLPIEQIQFEASGPDDDKTSRLLATLYIGSLPCHLEAIAVKENKKYGQVAANGAFENNLNGMFQAAEPDGAFDTIEMNGRDYVLLLTPHC